MSRRTLLIRWTKWVVAAVLLLAPAAVLYFADELERHFRGGYVHYSGFEVVTGLNGLDYLCAVLAVCLTARGIALGVMWLATVHRNPRGTVDRAQLVLSGDPFASWPVILVLASAIATILLSYIFGCLALGRDASVPVPKPFENLTPAAVFMNARSSIARNPEARLFITNAFASTSYEFRLAITSPNVMGHVSHSYEGYGWPMRCIFSPHGYSNTQDILRHLFFSTRSGYFILNNLAHSRLLPVPFAVNTATLALLLWGLWAIPVRSVQLVRERSRDKQGKCRGCGYILHGLARCPECGQTA